MPFVPPPDERAMAQAKKKPIGVMLPPPKPRQTKAAAPASAASTTVAASTTAAAAAASNSKSSPAKPSPLKARVPSAASSALAKPKSAAASSSSSSSASFNADSSRYTLGIDDEYGEPDSDDDQSAPASDTIASGTVLEDGVGTQAADGAEERKESSPSTRSSIPSPSRNDDADVPAAARSSAVAAPAAFNPNTILLPSDPVGAADRARAVAASIRASMAASQSDHVVDAAFDEGSSLPGSRRGSMDDALDDSQLDDPSGAAGGPAAHSGDSDGPRELVDDKDLFSLRGVPIVAASVLALLSLINLVVFARSGNGGGCAVLSDFVLCVIILSIGALASLPIVLRRMSQDADWSSSPPAKLMATAAAILGGLMLIFSIVVFVQLSSGSCQSDMMLRQMSLLDGVLLCSFALLAGSYPLLRFHFPTLDLSAPHVWRSHMTKATLALILLALFVANLVSVLVHSPQRNASFHWAITGWSPCTQAIDCHKPVDFRSSTIVCRNEAGAEVDSSACDGLPRPLEKSQCPVMRCADPATDEPVYAWYWDMPGPYVCPRECHDPSLSAGMDSPIEVELTCWEMRSYTAVGPGHCGADNAHKDLPDAYLSAARVTCPSNECTSCAQLWRFDLVYVWISCLLLLALSADVVATALRDAADSAAGKPGGRHEAAAGRFQKLDQHAEAEAEADVEAAAAVESGAAGESVADLAPPRIAAAPAQSALRPRSYLSALLSRYPRAASVVLALLLLSCFGLSLWACTQLLLPQCADYQAVSVIDVVVTLNISLASIVFALRARQQVWSAENPMEAIGLM